MNWEAIGAISELVGAIAVLVSLLYLASQVRQSTATTRVQTVQHLLTSDTASADAMIAGPLPGILVKLQSGAKLDPEEVAAYVMYMRGRVTEACRCSISARTG